MKQLLKKTAHALLLLHASILPGATAKAEVPDGVDTLLRRNMVGNFELKLETTKDATSPLLISFSGATGKDASAILQIGTDGIILGRKDGNEITKWKGYGGLGPQPWQVSLLKKGNFYRFRVNGVSGWIRGPLGEWNKQYDPWNSVVEVRSPGDEGLKSCSITTLPWLSQFTQPVVSKGPPGSFYEEQAIPGAILEHEGTYFLYFMAGMQGDQEGSSRRSIGVAFSKDLQHWDVHPEPLITTKDMPYDNIYVNGVTTTPEGKVALMFSAQQFPEWKGFMLATSSSPLGPFKSYDRNPVYKHFSNAHEFDLVRVDGPENRYVLFYSGYSPTPPMGPAGDRGYLLYSNDLVTWRGEGSNPVFGPQALDDWDAVHVRPRSLTKIGDMWYLWYEGCNTWSPPGSTQQLWWDTIGLARSRDLLKWEHYPRNPALPGLGADPQQFDNKWVGWPRMIVKGDTAYVFYTGGSPDQGGGVHIGLRTIRLKDLTNWDDEGGVTIDLLNPEN